jgi:glycosyltransferase involved in cell wall biosynthesis
MPLVTVVLPTRNRSTRLRRSVESVLAQTERELEVVVVDDASDDETPAAIAELSERDGRVRSIRLDAAVGPSAARNAGIAHASGNHLAYIDDDDLWYPNLLATMLGALRDDPKLGAVTCFFESYDEPSGKGRAFKGPARYPARALLWSNFAASVLGVVRRNAFASEPRFDEALRTCEDWDYWLACSGTAGVATVPEVLARVTFHGVGQSAFDRAIRMDGHERFVAKHRDAMGASCRDYHQARLGLMAAPTERERLALHMRYLRTLRPPVRRIVAREALAARFGRATGDPGRGPRTLLRLIRDEI